MSELRFPGCQKATDWVDWPADVDRLLVEPKLDGYRLSAVVDAQGSVSFHCGKSKSPAWAENLEHIADAIRASGVRSAMFDGEVMASTWNETAALIRRKRANMHEEVRQRIRDEVRFHTFDLIPLDVEREDRVLPGRRKPINMVPVPLSERRGRLETAVAGFEVIRLVPQFAAFSPTQLYQIFDEFVEFDFEGAMAKLPESLYAFDRVNFWQKLKPMETIEMAIVGAVEGRGKNAGMLGAFECLLSDGETKVNCGGGFTDELRTRFWHSWNENRSVLMGAVIEVKVQVGKVASAHHPVFLRFRPAES